jgi:hypothetical protein
MTAAAIMQPTYLPWLGYFALMDRVDVFVFLDSVQFDRRSWQQRNRIKGANETLLLTVPVYKKGLREQHISKVLINREAGFPERHKRSIELNYARAPYFDRYGATLIELLGRPYTLLADLTIALIEWLSAQFGITTRCLRSSGLNATGHKAELLADICCRLSVDHYISPPGSRDYLTASDAFDRVGVPFSFAEYEHPIYPQLHGAFVSYLSAMDLLFNVGPNSLDVIRQGAG